MHNPYETDKMVSDYLFFHHIPFDEGAAGLPLPEHAWDFASRLVSELLDPTSSAKRALDIGCAVGRSSFELSRSIPDVLGIDFSAAFINAAETLRQGSRIDFAVTEEGKRLRHFSAQLPDEIDTERIRFQQGDAMQLPEGLGSFDVVLAANLLCRLPEPQRFLDRLPSLVTSGGQLLLATPFSWLDEFTRCEHWIGGMPESAPSSDILARHLSSYFTLEHTTNIPFLIREHSRKYQYGISLGTRWRRR